MAELFLDPKGFEKQIDSFQSGADTIKALKYNLDKQGLKLRSIDKYMTCVEEYNATITLFASLLAQDTESMKLIKAKWMNVDHAMATKTLGEILFGE